MISNYPIDSSKNSRGASRSCATKHPDWHHSCIFCKSKACTGDSSRNVCSVVVTVSVRLVAADNVKTLGHAANQIWMVAGNTCVKYINSNAAAGFIWIAEAVVKDTIDSVKSPGWSWRLSVACGDWGVGFDKGDKLAGR